MDNEQLTSNLGELIKNQIDICEKLDKIGKQIKKIRKLKKPSNYDLNNIFGNPVEQLDKITCKQVNPDYICIVDLPEFVIKRGDVFRYSCRDNYVTIRDKQELRYCKDFFILHRDNFDNYEVKHATPRPDQAGDKIVNEVETPKQDQKYYLCIKDYGSLVKNGTVLKAINENTFIKNNDIKDTVFLNFIESQSNIFIPIQQFDTLKEGQEIEFTLRNGKTYKSKVKKSVTHEYYLDITTKCSTCPYLQLSQEDFKTALNKKYKCNYYPYATTLEDLTKDLNTLITLPDLSVKQPDQTDIRKQANELVDKFMPLVNGYYVTGVEMRRLSTGGKEYDKTYLYSESKQQHRKAAIKCAIVHCELMIRDCFIKQSIDYIEVKKELQKMLSE